MTDPNEAEIEISYGETEMDDAIIKAREEGRQSMVADILAELRDWEQRYETTPFTPEQRQGFDAAIDVIESNYG